MRRKERNEIRTPQQPGPARPTQPASARAAQPTTAAQAMAAMPPAPECTPAFTLEETGTFIAGLLEWLTVPRIVLGTLALLVVLVPLAVIVRGDDVRLLHAGDLFDAHQWNEASTIFASLRPSLLDQPDVSLQWARCLLETDQGAAAADCLEKRVRPNMSTVSPLLRRTLDADLAALSAWAQIETGNGEAGATALREFIKKNPEHVAANLALGRYALKAGLMDEAARCYNVLAHNEETAYVVPEFKSAAEKLAAGLPSEELAKLPEQIVKAPEPKAPATAPAVPAAPAAKEAAQPAVAAPTTPTAP